jgi:S1-C subfamily serine protease
MPYTPGQYPSGGQYPPGQYPGGGGYYPPGGYWPGQVAIPPKRSRAGMIVTMVVVFALLFVVAGTGLVIGVHKAMTNNAASQSSTTGNGGISIPNGTAGPTPTGKLDGNAIAATVNPGVVDINTVLGYENGEAAGTGMVIKSSGLVLTNNHVVAGATSVSVTEVTTGKQYKATVVGYDRTADVAVLQMTGASNLPTVSLADSSTVKVSDPIVAIGNAGGAGGAPTVVTGTVTGLNKEITARDEGSGASEDLTGLIEVAADIQAGDSGGPLVNASGKVIGIDTAASSGYQFQAQGGQGYAITINAAVNIANQILASKASTVIHIGDTAFLGVQASTASSGTSGAAVVGVVSGSPAATAGLAAGDVITSVDGKTIDTPTTLTTLLDGHHPGDQVTIGWADASGKTHSAKVKLIVGPVG